MMLISSSCSSLSKWIDDDLPGMDLAPPVCLPFSYDPHKFYTFPDHVLLCDGSRIASQHQQDDGMTFFLFDRWVVSSSSCDRQYYPPIFHASSSSMALVSCFEESGLSLRGLNALIFFRTYLSMCFIKRKQSTYMKYKPRLRRHLAWLDRPTTPLA
jgi:hypothetical protein